MKRLLVNTIKKSASIFTLTAFLFTSVIPVGFVNAQNALSLPHPGMMVSLSPTFHPAIIKGIKIFPNNPLRFDFIIDAGDSELTEEDLKNESSKLIKYFLASLTVPEKNLWVNLSPYEKDRIIPDDFGKTEMGRDLLALDYLLKQMTASLIYPEDDLGKRFWDKIYEKANAAYGTMEIPINTFNKVWIVPEKAIVYENGDTVFVAESRLKVMLEEDYVAMSNQRDIAKSSPSALDFAEKRAGEAGDPSRDLALEHNSIPSEVNNIEKFSEVSSSIIREIILPELEKEVNEGENFANLRQIYNSMILATWFKKNLKESFLGKTYVDQQKTDGIDNNDRQIKEKIYKQYLDAFEKGVYHYIKEDYDTTTQEIVPRKYFSGGVSLDPEATNAFGATPHSDYAMSTHGDIFNASVNLVPDFAGASDEDEAMVPRKRKFKALNYLFSDKNEGDFKVWSDDLELGEIKEVGRHYTHHEKENQFVPEPLQGVPERNLIWDFIRTPSTDKAQIKRRQDLLEALLGSNNLEKITKLKNAIYLINEGITGLYALYPIDDYHKERAIVAYREGHQVRGLESHINAALAQLKKGQEKLAEMIKTFGTIDADAMRNVVNDLSRAQQRLQPFNDNYFLKGDEYKSNKAEQINKDTRKDFLRLGVMVEFSNIAHVWKYARASFDPKKKAEYTQGWNFIRKKHGDDPQVVNDSPEDNPLTILCGTNMGGKSFHLMQNFYMQLLAQSFGYVPAEQGNFRIYDSILYIDRASTEAYRNLSAFGSEVDHWKEVLALDKKKTFLVVDEGFSTTSAEDQYAMLMGVSEYLRKRGGKTLISSHNEAFLHHYEKDDQVGIYHFPFTPGQDADGKPNIQYSYKLTEGIGDSRALEVAHALGLPEELIALAHQYLNNDMEKLDDVPKREWKKPEQYTEAERAEMKKQMPSTSLFGSGSKEEERLFHLFSEDSDFHHPYVSSDTSKRIELGGWGFESSYPRQKYIYDLLVGNKSSDPKEITERQKMFMELSKDDRYDEIREIGDKLFYLFKFMPMFLNATERNGFLDFNTAVISGRMESTIRPDENGIKIALMLLRLNKKVLGDEFPKDMEETLERIERYYALIEAYQKYTFHQDIFDIQKKQEQDYDQEITDPDIIAEFLEHAKDEPNKEKWQGKLTRRRIKEYVRWLKKHDKKRHGEIEWNSRRRDNPLRKIIDKVMEGFGSIKIIEEYSTHEVFNAAKAKKEFLKLAKEEPAEAKERWKDHICVQRISEHVAFLTKKYDLANEYIEEKTNLVQALDKLKNWIESEQSGLDVTDDTVRDMAGELFDIESGYNGRIIADRITNALGGLMDFSKDFSKKMPAKPIFEVDLASIREELQFFIQYHKEKNKGSDFEYDHNWPNELVTLLLLEMFVDEKDYFQEFLDILRSYDSVYLHQRANMLENEFSGLISIFAHDRWSSKTEADRLEEIRKDAGEAKKFFLGNIKKMAAICSVDEFKAIKEELDKGSNKKLMVLLDSLDGMGYRKMYKILKRIYESHIKGMAADYKEVESAYAQVFSDHELIKNHYDVGYIQTILENMDSTDRDKMKDVAQGWRELTDKVYPDIFFEKQEVEVSEEKQKKEVEGFKEFVQKEIIDSGLLEELKAVMADVDTAFLKVQEFMKKHGIAFVDDEGEPNEAAENEVKRGNLHRLEKTIYSTFYNGAYNTMYHYNIHEMQKEHSGSVLGTQALALFGRMINSQGFAPVDFNSDGSVNMKGMFNMLEAKEKQKVNDVHFGADEYARLIAAANMSGKTYYLKALIMALLSGMNTGFAPAQSASMPFFDHIVYFDRVTSKLDMTLSALGNEVAQWKKFFDLLSKGLNVFACACIDEMFSTTSPRYQSSLVYAVVMQMLKNGQYLAIASHNHDVLQLLREMEDEFIKAFTLKIHITDGKVEFDHKLMEMEEDKWGFSEAIPVARTLGMPEEILSIAEKVKEAIEKGEDYKAEESLLAPQTEMSPHLNREQASKHIVDNSGVLNSGNNNLKAVRNEDHKRMLQILNQPLKNKSDILRRQRVIEQLADKGNKDSLASAKEHVRGAREWMDLYSHFSTIDEDESHRDNPRRRLRQYIEEDIINPNSILDDIEEALQSKEKPRLRKKGKGDKDMTDEWGEPIYEEDPVEDKYRVLRQISGLVAHKESIDKFISEMKKISKQEDGLLKELVDGLESIYSEIDFPNLVEFVKLFENGEYEKVDLILKNIRLVNNALTQIMAFFEFADIASKDTYAKADFDENKKAGYKQGWLFTRDKDGQSLSDSPDAAVVVLSGSSLDEKSQYLQQNYFIQLIAQAFGYVPATEANIHIKDHIVYLDRPITDSFGEFGQEVSNWIPVEKNAGDNTVVFVDEPYSTAPSEEETKFLHATDTFLQGRGAQMVMATRNKSYIENKKGDNDALLIQFGDEVQEEEEDHTPQRVVEPKDFEALEEVTRTLGLEERYTQRAKRYLSGEQAPVHPPAPKERTIAKIEKYEPEEREGLKKKRGDFQFLFPTKNAWDIKPQDTEDEDAEYRRFGRRGKESQLKARHRAVEGIDGEAHTQIEVESSYFPFNQSRYSRSDIYFEQDDISHIKNRRYLEMFSEVLQLPVRNSKELHERQKMFEELMKHDIDKDFINIAEHLIRLMEALSNEHLNFNWEEFNTSFLSAAVPKKSGMRDNFENQFDLFFAVLNMNLRLAGLNQEDLDITEEMEQMQALQSMAGELKDLREDRRGVVRAKSKEEKEEQKKWYEEVYNPTRNRLRKALAEYRGVAIDEVNEYYGENDFYELMIPQARAIKKKALAAVKPISVFTPDKWDIMREEINQIEPLAMKELEHHMFSPPHHLLGIYMLHSLLNEVDHIKILLTNMRKTDSVYLHQLANYLEELLHTFFGDMRTGMDYLNKQVTIPEQIQEIKDDIGQLEELKKSLFEPETDILAIFQNYKSEMDAFIKKQKKDGRRARKRLQEAQANYDAYEKDDDESYWKKRVDEAKEKIEEDKEAMRKLQILKSLQEGKLTLDHERVKEINIELRGFIEINFVQPKIEKLQWKIQELKESKGKREEWFNFSDYRAISDELSKLQVIFHLADIFKKQNWTATQFTEELTLDIEEGWNIAKTKSEQSPVSMHMGQDEITRVVTGDDLKPEILAGKTMISNVVVAMSTGFAPNKSMKLPLFSRIITIDSLSVQDAGEARSSAKHWNEFFNQATQGSKEGPVLILIGVSGKEEEEKSTTTENIQDALSYAITEANLELGNFFMMATRSPQFAADFKNTNPDYVKLHHVERAEEKDENEESEESEGEEAEGEEAEGEKEKSDDGPSDSLKIAKNQGLTQIAALVEAGDSAMASHSSPTGGIDFNPANMALETQGQGIDVEFTFDPAEFENVSITGFTPVIFQITPITNFPLILSHTKKTSAKL